MGNRNRKGERDEFSHARRVIEEAFPGLRVVFGGSAGHRSPRVRTISFRLQDDRDKYRSNLVWVLPEQLGRLTSADAKNLVDRANGG